MAISRMNMERQLRNMGGLMTLEEPRQGYFLGKIVKKAKRAVKKVVKSPLGKLALLGGGAYLAGGFMPGGGGLTGGFSNFRNLGSGISGLFRAAGTRGATDKGGFLRSLIRDKAGDFSLGRAALTGLGATALAAPFLKGRDEDEIIDPGLTMSMLKGTQNNLDIIIEKEMGDRVPLDVFVDMYNKMVYNGETIRS